MLKTLRNNESARPKKSKVKAGSSGKDEFANMIINDNKIGNGKVRGKKNHQKTSKSKKPIKSKNSLDFLIFGPRLAFTILR